MYEPNCPPSKYNLTLTTNSSAASPFVTLPSLFMMLSWCILWKKRYFLIKFLSTSLSNWTKKKGELQSKFGYWKMRKSTTFSPVTARWVPFLVNSVLTLWFRYRGDPLCKKRKNIVWDMFRFYSIGVYKNQFKMKSSFAFWLFFLLGGDTGEELLGWIAFCCAWCGCCACGYCCRCIDCCWYGWATCCSLRR